MGTEHFLNKRIKDSGLKKKWLAEKCGVSDVLLSYYLNGSRTMPDHVESKLKEYV